MLAGSDQYECPRCNRKVDARKNTRLSKVPPYLNITIERYHYDLQKGERRKLNNPVSFPRRLELRLHGPPIPSDGDEEVVGRPVIYECIGYLEHVSDCAQSGHYTATLLQEDVGPGDRGADAAAGPPRHGNWWTLDDATVAAASWTSGGESDVTAPDRFESPSAYMVLYRRSDHSPGQLSASISSSELAEPLASFVDSVNRAAAIELQEFASQADAMSRFVTDRRRSVTGLVKAFQMYSANPSLGGFCVVPTAWLDAYVHGDDWREGAPSVRYGKTLLRISDQVTLDPLALWCGEAKLLPRLAFDAMRGLGGLDPSLFLHFTENQEVCEAVWRLFNAWRTEHEHLACVVDSKLTAAEVRALQLEGRGHEAVWVATRVHASWKKVVNSTASGTRLALWKAFLAEICVLRSHPDDTDPEEIAPCMLGGLLCSHDRVSRPRAGVLLRRSVVIRLLELSHELEATATHWPELQVRLRTGLSGDRLLGSEDVCGCACAPQRRVLVRRRYSSGTTRKLGELILPQGRVTGLDLATLVRDKLGLPVLRVLVREKELQPSDALEDPVPCIVVEKDETGAREGAAFEHSVFRTCSA